MVPSWYFFALLALAAFRLWKLLGNDRILDGPRRRFKRIFSEGRDSKLDLFIACPWCLGFWCCVVVYAGWIALGAGYFAWDEAFSGAVVLLALSAVVGLLATLLPEEAH